MSELPDTNAAFARSTGQLAFMPWARLKKSYSIGGVNFIPLRDGSGVIAPIHADASRPLTRILSGYIDLKGKSIDNCVVVTLPERDWNLADDDFPKVEWASSLLFLAAWASNDYFPRFTGPYVNASSFRVVWQRFSATPRYVSLTSRRRDGRKWDGGYKHGEVKFSVPLQCSVNESATVDEALLDALDRGNTASCDTIERLRCALPFVSLANTDDDLMGEIPEAILMGSAFEQLLGGTSAYTLTKEFGVLFDSSGSVTVGNAVTGRPGIEIDKSTSERADAQPKWWVHRKWMEELYDLRSKSVHKGAVVGRSWGWTPFEHLIMAAWVFPLVVKLLLGRDGHYLLSDDDKCHCLAVDKLLAATHWGEAIEGGTGPHRWHDIVFSTSRDYNFDSTMRKFFDEHPKLFKDESMEGSQSEELI